MEPEKGKTAKFLKEQQAVSPAAIENLKQFTRIKKSIVDALKEEELTISQLSEKLAMPKTDVLYYLMSLLKYGIVEKGEIDDMDEYFTYKIKKVNE
ncbi:MAG: winged helix-turn-helix transcriptional regulator [Bacteroidales bacterium]|nr:winged helix-turn-helix transcriptional regulator [Bacteroidales bacterium]